MKAHPLLLRKVQCKPNTVQPIMASILTYDPRGEFRFVFSSFSEHHIRPEDKAQYFRVIFETMEPGGYLIIGDEFLSPYESNNEAAYEHAWPKVHHNYIIKLATTSHLFEVAELEEAGDGIGKALCSLIGSTSRSQSIGMRERHQKLGYCCKPSTASLRRNSKTRSAESMCWFFTEAGQCFA